MRLEPLRELTIDMSSLGRVSTVWADAEPSGDLGRTDRPPAHRRLHQPLTQYLREREGGVALLNHTLVQAHDHTGSATFMAEILGLPAPVRLGPFAVVQASEATTLDFVHSDGPVTAQHYAFLVTEAEFDEIFARILARGLSYWADPGRNEPGEINTWDGGRGVYFDDPNGHLLEIITRPYGSGGSTTDHPHPLLAVSEGSDS
jgi:hypothetical protein